MAVHKRKWKSASGVQTNWYYVFDRPGSTRDNRRQILKSGFASKKAAQDAEAERRLSAQREYNLLQATPA